MTTKKCSKVQYKTHGAAFAAKRRLKNNLLDIYFCPKCKSYHLGRSNKPWRIYDRIGQVLDDYNKKHQISS
jgi:ribosomal protein L37AE/L43A